MTALDFTATALAALNRLDRLALNLDRLAPNPPVPVRWYLRPTTERTRP